MLTKITHALELLKGSNTLMDPCRSNIGGPDPCDPCDVDAYMTAGFPSPWDFLIVNAFCFNGGVIVVKSSNPLTAPAYEIRMRIDVLFARTLRRRVINALLRDSD